jgi:hypothetical protein
MLLVILLGVLTVLMFLCISNFLMSMEPTKNAPRKIYSLEPRSSEAVPPRRFRFAMIIRGVTKAIGTVFGKRPTGRKVTESAAVALMTSRVINGIGRAIRPRFLDRTS